MKRQKTDTERANEKINDVFYGENHRETPTIDIDPLLSNNNISLVLKNGEEEKD